MGLADGFAEGLGDGAGDSVGESVVTGGFEDSILRETVAFDETIAETPLFPIVVASKAKAKRRNRRENIMIVAIV